MAKNFQSLPENDFGGGIDAQSAENSIPQGFVESLKNIDPAPEGYLAKRKGYQGYAGFMPVRVTKVEGNGDELCFYLDSSISTSSVNLSTVRQTPIVAYGRTSISTSGDFDSANDVGHYYSGFTTDIRKTFLSGTNTLILTADETALTSEFAAITLYRSDSVTSNDNSVFLADSISINKSTLEVTITYTNNSGSDFTGFIAVQNKPSVSGTTFLPTPVSVTNGTTSTTSIPATGMSGHNLNNFNILVYVYVDTGTTLQAVIPNSVSISPLGTIEISVTNNSGSSLDFQYILTSVATTNVETGTIASGTTQSIPISSLDTDFIIAQVFLETSIGGNKELVLFDSLSTTIGVESSFTFSNNTGSDANFFIFYEFAEINSNKLCVDAITPATFTDSNPQLTLWGLDHDYIYGDNKASTRAGWVNHIDSYRSAGENRVVAGLGGNIFAARQRTEVGTEYLLPLLYPRLRNRAATKSIIGPAFVDSLDISSRSRGYIQFDGAGEGWGTATATTYDSMNGWVKYTLACPNLVVNGTLSTIISSTSGLEDILTIQQSGHPENSGSFVIKQISQTDTSTLSIWVENSLIDSSDYDESDAAMSCGVFSDRISLTATAEYIPNDVLLNNLLPETTILSVSKVSGTTISVLGATEAITIPAGLRLVGRRSNSRIMAIRDLGEAATVVFLLAGDMLSYDSFTRMIRCKYVNVNSDINVLIDGDGETATATLQSGDTSAYTVGSYILLSQAGNYTGEFLITGIPSLTTLEFSSTLEETGVSGVIVGKTIELDEALEWEDSLGSTISVEVPSRWIPVEAPTDDFTLTPSTYVQHFASFDYAQQAFIRSSMVNDSLFLTNGSDAVTKYDGSNLYRAGLPRWQPQFFVTTDTSPASGGEIVISTLTADVSAITNDDFTINIKDAVKFRVGDVIQHSSDDAIYLIISVSSQDTSDDVKVSVDRTISSATVGTISKTVTFKYYFRLNAVDANNNVIATAPVGSEDFRVVLGESAQVRIKLVGFPAWDIYDYDRLEVQIYRTKANLPAPFYLLTTLPLQFDNGNGYLIYNDAASDDTLLDEELDAVSSVLKGAELGTGWSPPLRAKFVTTSGNKLILANIKSYPELDIRLIDKGSAITSAVLAGDIYTFKKDNTDLGTVTDMVSRANFEFVTSPTGGISNVTSTASYFEVTTDAAHGLAVGDWVYLFRDAASGSSGLSVNYMGWYMVSAVPGGSTFRVASTANLGALVSAQDVDSWVSATVASDIPVYIGTDRNYGMRNGNRSALVDFETIDSSSTFEFFAMRRLCNAINAVMRVTDTTISGMESFEPWMIAEAGSEYNAGQLVVRQPKTTMTTLEVTLPTFSTYNIYVNQILRSPTEQVSAQTLLFPSRLIASYTNYPEIFDSPTVTVDAESDSAFDVNPADGQDITMVIPFFGESAFGAAQKDSIIVVFKTNSIYLVNLAAKVAGLNPVQRIESQGIGCTMPHSVAVTRDGIMFANESGIFRLTRDLKVDEFVGQKLDRLWTSDVNKESNALELLQGHHYPLGKQYKVSFPLTGATANSDVFVYNHTRESRGGIGSWTRYDSHPTTGWCNLGNDAYQATTRGQVFSLRRSGTQTDYRDDATAITAEAVLRANDFGDSGIRKTVKFATLHFRNTGLEESTEVTYAVDLEDNFREMDAVKLFKQSDSKKASGLSDPASKKIETVEFSLGQKKGDYFQIKVTNDGFDESMELTRVDYRVAGLNDKGLTQAAETTK